MSAKENCLRYWDLCSVIPIDDAVALWCGVEPEEVTTRSGPEGCRRAKREAIINALYEGRLEYEDRPIRRSDGRGTWFGAKLEELIEKDGVRIKKDSLRRWFLDMPFDDRPAFLFDESRGTDLLPDGGATAEMNSMRALALMAWILAENKSAMRIADRPNAAQIGDEVAILAQRFFGENFRGFASFNKKLSKALNLLEEERQGGYL